MCIGEDNSSGWMCVARDYCCDAAAQEEMTIALSIRSQAMASPAGDGSGTSHPLVLYPSMRPRGRRGRGSSCCCA